MNPKLSFLVSGFFVGVLLRSFVDLGFALALFLFAFALAFFLIYFVTDKSKVFILAACLCLGVGLGVARYEWRDSSNSVQMPTELTGVINEEPDEGDSTVSYRVRLETRGRTLSPDFQGPTSRPTILVSARSEPRFEYGDRVSLGGKVSPVQDFAAADGTIVPWRKYLARDEIYFQMSFANIELVEHGQGNWLIAKLLVIKHAFLSHLAKLIPEPEAALGGGLTVGAKQAMGKELLDKFRVAGLIHVVVLSGYNLTIVALAVMWFCRKFLSERVSIILGIVTIILFGLMTGGSSTVVRASVMAILGYLALATGRTSEVARALVIAALLMLIVNPKVLVFDIGFQLSFLATLGLIYLEPFFARLKFIERLPKKILTLEFRSVASATLGAQLAVFPIILYTFGNFSLYAFPINMLVLPLVPLSMLLVFLTGLAGLASSLIPPLVILAKPLAWLAYLVLAYFIGLVNLVSHLPFANLQVTHVPFLVPLICYVVLIWAVLKFRKKEHLGV